MPAPLSSAAGSSPFFPNYRSGTFSMVAPSPATSPTTVGAPSSATLAQSLALFVIRRRIVLSNILFTALVATVIVAGVRPRDLLEVRDASATARLLLVTPGVAPR